MSTPLQREDIINHLLAICPDFRFSARMTTLVYKMKATPHKSFQIVHHDPCSSQADVIEAPNIAHMWSFVCTFKYKYDAIDEWYYMYPPPDAKQRKTFSWPGCDRVDNSLGNVPTFIQSLLKTSKMQNHCSRLWIMFYIRHCDRPLPGHTSASGLANTFNNYFLGKITNPRSKLDGSTTNTINTSTITSSDLPTPLTFTKFTSVTEEDIRQIVQKSNSNSYGLGPITTSMIEQLIAPLVSILTKIVNLSLRDGIAPRTLKSATVTPLILKKYLSIKTS